MDKAEFWSTKARAPQWETVAIAHPGFASTFRLVANVFEAVTLGGNEYTPVPMTIRPPDNGRDAQQRLTLAFPRQVVGRQFKQALTLIAGSRDPIEVTYAVWLSDTDAPKVSWLMYASDQGGIAFDPQSVQITATLDNPMRRRAAPIYTPDEFPGLELL
jgi:hypothetical protein